MTVLHLCHNKTEAPPLRSQRTGRPLRFAIFTPFIPNGRAITPPAHDKPSRKDARTNRERILTAARETFAASSSASLSAIARQAGVGIGTLYRHFPSREALIVELYRHDIQHLIDLARALAASRPPLEALRLWFGEVARYGQLKYGAGPEIIHAATSDEEYYEPFVRAIAVLLDHGTADGSSRKASTPRTSCCSSACCGGSTRNATARPGRERILGLIIDGLLGRELNDLGRTEQGVELSQRARVRAGDHDEFGVLFDEHARAVYNHAFRLTGNWSPAEEVVSLTFLEAWRLRGTVGRRAVRCCPGCSASPST